MNSPSLRGSTFALFFSAALVAAPADAQSKAWTNLGFGSLGSFGVPQISATTPTIGRHLTLRVDSVPTGTAVAFILGFSRIDFPIFGGTFVPDPVALLSTQSVGILSPSAQVSLRIPPNCTIDLPLFVQAVVADAGNPSGLAFSDALETRVAYDAPHDFNGDGLSDFAIAVPNEEIGGLPNAGGVAIRYGGAVLPQAFLRQGADVDGPILGTAEADDFFGSVLAIGDFDGDGFDDLAVGVPRENSESPAILDFGVVHVIYGSAQGLQGGMSGRNDRRFRQGQNGVADQREAFDLFGASLAAADFDGDGCDDLAIGVPFEDDLLGNQGIVHVLFGSESSGLTGTGSLVFDDPEMVELDGRFGWNLAAGDFDADGRFEVVVGNPYGDVGVNSDAGSVTIVSPGVFLFPHITLRQSGGDITLAGVSEPFDLFGFSLAVGDFDNDGVDDLTVGVPFEDLNGGAASAAGSVNVVYGSFGTGLVGAGNRLWHQDSAGMIDSAELSDRYGYSLAAGDFDNDGDCDLAVGVPRERLGLGNVRTGAVHLISGVSGMGLTAAGNTLWHQGLAGSANPASADDEFGFALTTLDWDGDCHCDLLVGAPGEDIGLAADAGGAHLFLGSPVGVTMTGNTFWDQGPLSGSPEAGDRLGAALAGSPDQVPL